MRQGDGVIARRRNPGGTDTVNKEIKKQTNKCKCMNRAEENKFWWNSKTEDVPDAFRIERGTVLWIIWGLDSRFRITRLLRGYINRLFMLPYYFFPLRTEKFNSRSPLGQCFHSAAPAIVFSRSLYSSLLVFTQSRVMIIAWVAPFIGWWLQWWSSRASDTFWAPPSVVSHSLRNNI